MRGKIVRAKKSNCKRKNQFGKWFPEMWACASFYIWSGSRCPPFILRWVCKVPVQPYTKGKKRPPFSAEERVVLSLQCSMCANFAFFVGLFLKGMRGEGKGGAGCYLNVQLHLHSKWDITGKTGSQHSTSRDLEISPVSTGEISCFYRGQTFERGLKLMLRKDLVNSVIV